MIINNSLIPKLLIAGAAEKRNGVLVFSPRFKAHVFDYIGDANRPIETVSNLRNLFGQFDPSLASLNVHEIADLMALLVFQFNAIKARTV